MTHDPLCPDSEPNRWVSTDFNGNSMSCRCEEYAKVRQADWATDNAYWTGQTEGYAAALDAAEQALLRLEADMRNWSSDETRAATSAVPELTADKWIWAQHGVGRSVQVIRGLRESQK